MMRWAALLLAATQLALGTAPLFESGGGSPLSHMESGGTKLHNTHDEANCIACTAHRILAGAELGNRALPADGRWAVLPLPPTPQHGSSNQVVTRRSRAPPLELVS
ncbi:MAG: hypothetical protein H7Z74_03320 [Anaerolineae bacterium]|nr:hypothetical protein [Gemmatimonadaceae bacterium]